MFAINFEHSLTGNIIDICVLTPPQTVFSESPSKGDNHLINHKAFQLKENALTFISLRLDTIKRRGSPHEAVYQNHLIRLARTDDFRQLRECATVRICLLCQL